MQNYADEVSGEVQTCNEWLLKEWNIKVQKKLALVSNFNT